MFRISQFMQALHQLQQTDEPAAVPTTPPKRQTLPGPVVIWNLIRRCNLTCKHCYSISADTHFKGELGTDEIYRVMDDLKAARVPVLILSGGEPLLHPDIFPIARRAKAMGFYVGLSTNGTLINDQNIDDIATTGFDYVGISLDGLGDTHDRFRRKAGAFDASLAGIRLCKSRQIRVGIRFTMTQDNAAELPLLLDLMNQEQIDKFYFSHLNYAGRGNKHRADDVMHRTTRWAMDQLFEACWQDARQGRHREFVTGNNDADGVYLLQWVRERFPAYEAAMRYQLARWGGNASGVNVANIDNLGVVHPDTMWWDYPLGNVRDRGFGDIWQDTRDPLMAGLKQHPRPLKGRCQQCRYVDICGGNTRVRAWQITGDAWQEDPACYMLDEELGITAASQRITTTPYIPIKRVSTC
ncbi:heme d1 biosynthesis radical SAM protein NirJ [Chitinivorax tropicus]|uniref:Pre-heme d1 synthase n=1 Tax=Chitinivorax tropicus TaxID=714531 RepID=A0A840MHL2_9PROT|nr:heme d1 biosynthesis radical SAM protein NirJ [Chitinivorax tropicus]MBB5018138.1 heme d1 biosynthesis radical SAM protein NirJ [Chitinivorax tropicus]